MFLCRLFLVIYNIRFGKKNPSLLEMNVSSLSSLPLEEQAGVADTKCSEDVKFARSLRRRPWINYAMFDVSSGEEYQKKPTKLVNILHLAISCYGSSNSVNGCFVYLD